MKMYADHILTREKIYIISVKENYKNCIVCPTNLFSTSFGIVIIQIYYEFYFNAYNYELLNNKFY